MSFDSLNLVQLKTIAESFGVDSPNKITKQNLINLLHEEGVTYEMYQHFDKIEKDKEEVQREEEQMQAQIFVNQPAAVQQNRVLVKMERTNASYMVGRYTFTQEHPFVAMPVGDAQYIFDTEAGFRLATPTEVQNYYN